MSNAVKFSPPDATIEIAAKREQEQLVLDVIDAGPGIDDADKSKIFDAFYRGRRASQSAIQGTGLGLSIAREYVLEHDGSLMLVERASEGAHFRVTLPLAHLERAE